MYASLTEDSKKAFMNEVLSAAMESDYSKDTDFKALYDNTYFPGYVDGSKKYMIISGTSPSGEGSSAAFEERVNNVMNYFGDEYIIQFIDIIFLDIYIATFFAFYNIFLYKFLLKSIHYSRLL